MGVILGAISTLKQRIVAVTVGQHGHTHADRAGDIAKYQGRDAQAYRFSPDHRVSDTSAG